MSERILASLLVCWVLLGGSLATAQSVTGPRDDYRVGPMDVLNVSVWKQPTLSGTFSVGSDGVLMFPLIGRVTVSGLSRSEIEASLRGLLADGYLRDPNVTVTVDQYRSRRVFVSGEVRQPGTIALSEPITLLEALARVGSVTEHAGSEAIVARPPREANRANPATLDTTSEIIRVDIKELQRGVLTHNLLLRDGDTIFVPRAATIHVMGEIKNAGEYPIFAGMTIAEVLSRAGGVTERGSSKRVRVMRAVNGRKNEIKVGFNSLVQPGDIVIIRERIF